jgi:hypothetical protein
MLQDKTHSIDNDIARLNALGDISDFDMEDLTNRFNDLNGFVIYTMNNPGNFDGDMRSAEWDLAMFEVDAMKR